MPGSSLIRSIGINSLASSDGVVVALLDTDGRDDIRPLGGMTLRYEENLRWRLLEAIQNDLSITEVLRLEKELTELHAQAVEELRDRYPEEAASATLIGYSGHTIRHIPGEQITQQIGNPWLLAQRTRLPVVADFRRHDMSNGGQGAPLVAMFHWALMANEPRPALMLDLGVLASMTWLSTDNEIIAGDTGPGIGLLNEWVQEVAETPHDLDGRLSARGRIDQEIVQAALEAPFFQRELPKAADRDDFDPIDVSGLSVEDGAATLCAVTVETFCAAVNRLPAVPDLLWVTGIGSRQPLMVELLAKKFDRVANVSERGLNPDTLEAECYAWLAVRHQRRLPITTPETTGCERADSAGSNTFAPFETTVRPRPIAGMKLPK
jgi:anhydro-N-acetylmuramic acid kinase